jgi:hypothetical protein
MAPVSLVISLIRSTSVVHEWTYKVVGQANVAYRDSHTFVRRGYETLPLTRLQQSLQLLFGQFLRSH